jgi:hypothetical protein
VEVVEVVRGAGTAGAAEVVNNVRVTPFILVVKTDQVVEKNGLIADDKKTTARQSEIMNRLREYVRPEMIPPLLCLFPDADHKKMTARQWQIVQEGKFLHTSGPDQFRLPLHPFAHYDFTIDWGDGTTEVVRSDAPAGKAIVDEAWLAQVKKGLDQSVTFDAFKAFDTRELYRMFEGLSGTDVVRTLSFSLSEIESRETEMEKALGSLLNKAGLDGCANIIIDPKILEKDGLQRAEELVSKQTFGAMKLSEFFEQLTKLTGLTYVLHDRALLITERKDPPPFGVSATYVCAGRNVYG